MQPEVGPASGQRLTWREQRWERRRRRRVVEEALGWLLVPVILVGGYWLVIAVGFNVVAFGAFSPCVSN